MCQRISLVADLPDLVERFRIGHVVGSYKPRYNIAPTQSAAVIFEDRRERILDTLRWGLMPYWSKDAVNADGQGIGDRPIFKRILNKQRCVIPISGFYGWRTQGKVNQPVHFVLRDRRTFAVPGFYEIWPRVEGGDIRAYTMLTTAPNDQVAGCAERMPAILDEAGIDAWLSEGNVEYRGVYPHIRRLESGELIGYPVGAYVNDRSNEAPECVEPIRAAYASLRR
ncbi:SOS response-associated peptidase [Cohnella sp. REN36]|uniref:SOS response-associated peptidase n=1 Tax=Cohnella sp. REN36 TaxID=2887347 RepID=UPI001D1486F4|nr:SOS response-associated peptidase [Cohnella sp. REN36]MCC3373131.1 SOS response-associated peptidase [Cohnella sp. REN36]